MYLTKIVKFCDATLEKVLKEIAEGAPDVDEGAHTVPAPVHVPQPPPAVGPARTLPQRVARLEEKVHGMREALGEQREVLDSMACDFPRFTT
ncbi:hypothetical protein Tco_1337070 [Tanacetum coccineum]